MTEHDVLVGFRLRLFTLADELGNVSAACRAMGVDRSTYYRLKAKVDRWGLEALNVRERRRPRMPNQIGPHLEQRIIAFSLGHPGYGPRRISAELAREKWGAIRISEHGVWNCVMSGVSRARHGHYYFRQLVPGTYDLVPVTGQELGVDPFWAYLRGSGPSAAVFDVPEFALVDGLPGVQLADWATHQGWDPGQIGRASCRERVL